LSPVYRLSIPFQRLKLSKWVFAQKQVWFKLVFLFFGFYLKGFSNNWLFFIILTLVIDLPVVEFSLLHMLEENKLVVVIDSSLLKV